MAYRYDKESNSIVLDGWENGIANSPYGGIANTRNVNTNYYPGVAYSNYKRQAATVGGGSFFAGTHSVNVSNNYGWFFTASVSMTNPVYKAQSPALLNYILDDSGQVWKQTAVNSSTFNILEGGSGRVGLGNQGLEYWNNYLVVFGDGFIEFCGDGTGDSAILSTKWNLNNAGAAHNTAIFTTNFATSTSNLIFSFPYYTLFLPRFEVNDPVQFTTTGTLPTGLSLNTTYYIKTITYNTTAGGPVTVSSSVGGAAVTFSDNGTGTHTITDYGTPLPLGNCTNLVFTGTIVVGDTSLTFSSYTNPLGVTVNSNWQEASGNYNIVFPDGTKVLGTFTKGSATITLLSPLVYITASSDGSVDVELLDSEATHYKPYVSKVDGNLYFCNGRNIGRILSQNANIAFNPGLPSTYVVNTSVTSLLQPGDDTIDMVDLSSKLVIAGNKDLYVWDYISATTGAPNPVGEQIVNLENLLNNIYVFAGQKGNIYSSNGYSSQLLYKVPDYISGVIDPVWVWGDVATHRSKLLFQLSAKNTSGTFLLAGVFSLIVSPGQKDSSPMAFSMEAQNSYGLTPSSGALGTGVLIDNSPSSTGYDSYYSGWSNGATTGGIDYNDTTLWQNFEPTIETDIIPIGTILEKATLGNIEFKLDRPLSTGDQIRMYFRPSLSDSYTLMGTTTTAQLSDYYPSNISQGQWVQFLIQYKCASSSSSKIPLREVRLHLK